jgi:hypothetical protein
MQQPAHHHRPVGDQVIALAYQGMDPAESVLEVLVAELAVEGVVEQGADVAQVMGAELGCVRDADVSHGSIL